MTEKNYEFKGNVIIKGKIKCETGLHIGGSKEKFEIGGIDAPVLRDPFGYPYIPGSSLKGKMRYLLEWDMGKVKKDDGKPHNCEEKECVVCRVFGTSAEKGKAGPTRLIVRDTHPTKDTKEMWENKLDTDLLYTEHKKENVIDRITSHANPRDMERVPKDSEFAFEMIYSVYDINDGGKTDLDNIDYVFKTINLLEDSALGGSGSRGYGKIKFVEKTIVVKSRDDYKKMAEGKTTTEEEIKKVVSEHLSVK